MKIPRFYSGKFNPYVDIPVNPQNQAITLEQFARLPLETQKDILAKGHMLGDPGVPNPDIDYVPPMCRKGVTLAQLLKTYKSADSKIKAGVTSHRRDVLAEAAYKAATAAQKASTESN